MKPYEHLTVGELKALTPEQIDAYSLEVGEAMLDDLATRAAISRAIGKRKIEAQLEKLKQIDKDLNG